MSSKFILIHLLLILIIASILSGETRLIMNREMSDKKVIKNINIKKNLGLQLRIILIID